MTRQVEVAGGRFSVTATSIRLMSISTVSMLASTGLLLANT